MSKFDLEKDIDRGLDDFPKLRKVKTKKQIKVEGELDISHKEEEFIESYKVRLQFPKRYPYRYPIVTELENKIPKKEDWHCNSDGTLCIAVEPTEILECRRGITLNWFIDEKLIPHFAIQTYRRMSDEDEYPIEEYSHREEGLKEAYLELCETGDWDTAKRIIQCAIDNKIGRNDPCFCGSKKKFKKCHWHIVEEITKIGRENLFQHLSLVNSTQKVINNTEEN